MATTAPTSAHERLNALAEIAISQENTWLCNEICEIVEDLRENYVRLESSDIPTVAQGVSLARVLRGFMVNTPYVRGIVAPGGFDLPNGYLQVELQSNGKHIFTCGIARDGASSS